METCTPIQETKLTNVKSEKHPEWTAGNPIKQLFENFSALDLISMNQIAPANCFGTFLQKPYRFHIRIAIVPRKPPAYAVAERVMQKTFSLQIDFPPGTMVFFINITFYPNISVLQQSAKPTRYTYVMF